MQCPKVQVGVKYSGQDPSKVKRISQELFDECVNENIEEFEMELDEAIEDAITQFEGQGVDLSNLIISKEGREAASRLKVAMETLKNVIPEAPSKDKIIQINDVVLNQINLLLEECNKNDENKLAISKDGGLETLTTILIAFNPLGSIENLNGNILTIKLLCKLVNDNYTNQSLYSRHCMLG